MSQVATNLRNTRERARLLRFEPTGLVTKTNVQTAIEQVSAGSSVAPGPATPVTATPYVILTTDTFIYVNFAGTVALTLPDAAAWLAAHANGLPLTIKDISGAAAANNITITRAGADTIDGATNYVIASDYGGVKLRPPAAGSWSIVG